MIVISKKRIQIVTTCVLISVLAFTFQIAKEEASHEEIFINTVETTATPASGKTIVLDAGHGVPDEGAQSSTRNNRSGNKFKNSAKITKFIRAKWKYSNIDTFR